MWIKHPSTGMVVYTSHEAHIARLLAEGGTEMPDPRVQVEPEPEQVEVREVHEVIDISKKRRHAGRRG